MHFASRNAQQSHYSNSCEQMLITMGSPVRMHQCLKFRIRPHRILLCDGKTLHVIRGRQLEKWWGLMIEGRVYAVFRFGPTTFIAKQSILKFSTMDNAPSFTNCTVKFTSARTRHHEKR